VYAVMYSLTAVGGIQYTTEMVKNNTRKTGNRQNHVFRGCREVIISGSATNSSAPANIITNASGSYAFSWPLSPLGLTVATYGTTTYSPGTEGNLFPPVLRGLRFRAQDFQMYRVTRAKLVFVGNLGSTQTGAVTLAGYTDVLDTSLISNQGNVSSTQSAKSFDLASASSRELSVNIPVDSSWKKVTSILSTPGGSAPFAGSSVTMLVPVNSAADLCFGAVSISVVNAGATTNIGCLYVDYDVEFKGVVDPAVNF